MDKGVGVVFTTGMETLVVVFLNKIRSQTSWTD